MATSMLELGVGTGKWDAGLKKAKQSLDNFTQANGGLQQALEKESQKMQKFVQMMGQMDSTAKTAKGQMNDYKATIEQLTMQYNRMSEAQKKTIGQDYLNSIDQIKEKFRQAKAEMEGINKSLGDMKMPDMKGGGFLSGIGDKMSGMMQVFGGNLLAEGVSKLTSELTGSVQESIELARQGEGIRMAFERLNNPGLLDELKAATHGTVSEIELMQQAIKFENFKLPVEDLANYLAFAQQKAKDTGESIDYLVNSIVTGLGRQSKQILDNLGISAAELTRRMNEGATMTQAVSDIIREEMAKAGDYVETAADRAARAAADTKNKMEDLGHSAMPVAEEFASAWNEIRNGAMTIVLPVLKKLADSIRDIREILNGEWSFDAKISKMPDIGSNIDDNGNFIRKPSNGNWAGFNAQTGQYNDAVTAIQDIVVTGKKRTGRSGRSGRSGGSRGGTTHKDTPKTEEQQNADRIAELVKQYQDLATAAKTADDAQKIGMTERMAKIQGEITTLQDRNTELKKFADEARQVQYPVGSLPQLNEQLKTLQTEQAKALDAKQWKDYQRQIEQTQYQIDALKGKWQDGLQATFKLDDLDVLEKLRDIEGITIDPKTLTVTANTADAYNQVEQLLESVDGKTVTFAVQPKMETGTSIQNDAGMSGYIASIKQQLETADYGTSLYNGLSAQLADMTTLQNLVGESLKAGLGTAMFDVADETGADFWTRAMEGGVDNIDWQAIVDKINEARKAAGLDAISLDFTTGSVSSKDKKEKDGLQDSKTVLNAISQLTSGLQSIGVKIPSEIQSVISVMQGVMQVIEAVNTIIGVTQTSALTANTIAMGALTSALWANTTASWIPFAGGGIVPHFAGGGLIGKAALGMTIPGRSYSGDLLRLPVDGGRGMIGVNSGEVIMNQAQAGILESELSGGRMRDINVHGVLQGENIVLAVSNYFRRTGKGEAAMWGKN